MDLTEKTISSERLFAGKILSLEKDVVKLPDGKQATREVVRHNGGVTVLAIDEADNILFVRQFRYPYARLLLELPAGKLEKGEIPAECAARELEEETGFAAEEFCSLGEVYPSPGYVDEVLHLYLARGLTLHEQHLDEDEFLEVEKIPLNKAVEYCVDGTLNDAKTVVSILRYHELRRLGRV